MTTVSPPAYRKVYVWELPVRIFHWINAACVTVLCATGFLIGTPLTLFDAAEAYQQYWFGTLRLVHFTAAYVFVLNFAVRFYWGFVGNRYAHWRAMLPYTRARLREIVETLRVDVLQLPGRSSVGLGHNALAGVIYSLSFATVLFQVATGFALYAPMSESAFPALFSWIVPLFGGDAWVRVWHHAALWFFVLFFIVHVYLVGYHDQVERRGIVSSIVSGWKFVERDAPDPPEESE